MFARIKAMRITKKQTIVFVSLAVLVVIMAGLFIWGRKPSSTQTSQAGQSSTQPPNTKPTSFDKGQFSLTDPTSIWVVVDKLRPLNPTHYAPTDLVVPAVTLAGNASDQNMHLRQASAGALEAMFAAANKQGLKLMLVSGYRSYSYQTTVYNNYVKQLGRTAADQQSARPGYSEHQTGFAADVAPASGHCSVEQCFADTPEGEWLAANSYKYGFIIRYTKGKQAVTGYEYEPWHIRYIGKALATEMHNQHVLTLEEFFDLPAAPDYQ